MSTVATFSATRAGWMKPNGMSVTPKPSRMFSVDSARPPRIASERRGRRATVAEVVLDAPTTVLKPSVSANWISAIASS